ncbi:hypothetical protein BGW39_000381, partial [Mortierella sp. 14UC]
MNVREREWADHVENIERYRIRSLVDQLVKAFARDQFKGSTTIAEIVLVGPVLDHEMYRNLLGCFISTFEKSTLLDLNLLQGLVQLVECASPEYLVDNDMVRIATVLSKELNVTHTGTSDHPLYLTWALSRVLDVMVAGKVKDLNRERDHQPILQLLASLKDSSNTYLKHQAAYAFQALQYAPDDETPLQVIWRFAQGTASIASAATSVFKMDPKGFLEGIETFQQISGGMSDFIKASVEGAKAAYESVKYVREGGATATRAAEKRSDSIKSARGRLADFNQVVAQASCRHNANFQWGICRQLGEIAVDPLWDSSVRQQAVDFLGELYKNDAEWKPRADVKRWILTILVQISELSVVSLQERATALLE